MNRIYMWAIRQEQKRKEQHDMPFHKRKLFRISLIYAPVIALILTIIFTLCAYLYALFMTYR